MKTETERAAYEAVSAELLSALKNNLTVSIERDEDYIGTVTVSISFDGTLISRSTARID